MPIYRHGHPEKYLDELPPKKNMLIRSKYPQIIVHDSKIVDSLPGMNSRTIGKAFIEASPNAHLIIQLRKFFLWSKCLQIITQHTCRDSFHDDAKQRHTQLDGTTDGCYQLYFLFVEVIRWNSRLNLCFREALLKRLTTTHSDYFFKDKYRVLGISSSYTNMYL